MNSFKVPQLSIVLLLSPCLTACVHHVAPSPKPLIVGEVVVNTFESPHPYRGGSDDTPTLVFTHQIHHPGASYIAPHFSRFDLADGDYLVIRSPTKERTWRYEGGIERQDFWGIHIHGDTAIVELFSGGSREAYGFVIDSFARGFAENEIELGTEAICGADDSEEAKCYQNTEPQVYDNARAVARLLTNGTSLCTGWLLGSEGHVITNNHCIENAAEAANTNFEFMAEGASCTTNCEFQLGCPGVVEEVSSTLVRTSPELDYTLVSLPNNHTVKYGFLAIRPFTPSIGERIYIPQHAAGWGKRVAVLSAETSDVSGFAAISSLNEPACTGGPPDVGYFADTQGGSSGSPVLGYKDHSVVALHHCANCPNRGVLIDEVILHMGGEIPDDAIPPRGCGGCATIELNGQPVGCRSDRTPSPPFCECSNSESLPSFEHTSCSVCVWSQAFLGGLDRQSLTSNIIDGNTGNFIPDLACANPPPPPDDP